MDMRFAFIAKHCHIWPVSWLCNVLDVSRSGFHAWLNRPTRAREIHYAKLVTAIETSFKASDRTYGARRVWRDVLEEGLACGLHRIERLMRINALRARPRRRGKPKDDGERSVIADIEPVTATGSKEPARLDRDFQAHRPNQKWLADFTCIWTAEGWLYVAVVLDCCRENDPPDRFLILLHLALRRRMVHEGRPGCIAGHGRADDGRVATRQGRCSASSLGPGIAIYS
jgi:putative transposase